MITSVRVITVVWLMVLGGACGGGSPGAAPSRVVQRAGTAMGSELRLTAYAVDDAAAQRAFDAVFGEFERLDALLSV